MGLVKEFMDFLKEYNAISLAIAFIIGAALTTLVQSLVNDVVMPFVTPLIPGGEWQEATLALGPVMIKWGSFLGAFINFVIISFVVFVIAKKVLKEDKVKRK